MGKFRSIFFGVMIVGNAFLCLVYLHPQRFLPTSSDNADTSAVYKGSEATSNSTTVPSLPSTGVASFPGHFPLDYVIPAKDICQKSNSKKFFLMIIVCSAVKNAAERQAIRDTWGSAAYKSGNTGSVRVAFLLGTSADENESRLVEEEAKTHRDLIQVDFVDSYQNLTYKSVALLKWVSESCQNALYVLKSDDDMYINIPNLARAASRMVTKKNVMFGVLFRNAPPERNKSAKWFVPMSQYSGKVFPDYLSGTAYAMSRDSVPKLYAASQNQPFLVMEDVFVTGICASKAGVKRLAARDFTHQKRPSTGCAFRDSITGHHVSIPEMRKIWRELRNGPTSCKSRVTRKVG